jgi:hypothetical protein
MSLRKVEHPNGKSFHWACNSPNCPYESEEIRYTMENYHADPPRFCPRCGLGENPQFDSLPASIIFKQLCACGHSFSSHDNSSAEMSVDGALLSQQITGNIYTDEPRGKTRCKVKGCICLTWRPAGADASKAAGI